ncbi:MAG: DUF2336 domain-containing protein [Alphaproteobacteria bacterium]|nr:DUF2336 domain-containing protein [Alphaproteobacteria bacterium]MBF0130859.1 DUF2336 domain-containing protein [Alphaproteobacteria bacterium]
MEEGGLSTADVARLLADPSGSARAETAERIARGFDAGAFSESERALAEDIFRLMLRDAEIRVREALSANLKQNPQVPHDIARALALDEETVALPMLQFSEVLTADDLVEIVRGRGAEKQKAVARRAHVDEAVADALVDCGNEEVVATLVANDGADLSEGSLHRVVDRFGDRETVQGALADRERLPVTVTEKLVAMVSEHIKARLMARPELPAALTADLVLQARERVTIGLAAESSDDDVETLIRHLLGNDRLTPSIVVRAVCMGDMAFFEHALAALAGVNVVGARKLIHDSGPLGLKGICAKAKLPPSYYPAVRAGVDTIRETPFDGEPNDRERYQRRVIERILTRYGDLGVDFAQDDLDYLLTRMDRLPVDSLQPLGDDPPPGDGLAPPALAD